MALEGLETGAPTVLHCWLFNYPGKLLSFKLNPRSACGWAED